ncbi:MAG: hypothetical protein ACOQNV_03025 [Mycoplasmoidaceae bacterium]
MENKTKKFDFGKKSLKNLICTCIYFAAIVAYIPIMVIYQGQFLSINFETKAPDINIGITIGMGLCALVSMVVGIMLLVYDINLARHAKSSKTFGHPMISILTFAIIPAICVAMSIVEYYVLFSESMDMIAGIFEIMEKAQSEQEAKDAINALVKAAFATISNISIISSGVMAGVVVWQIILNSLNIHVNKR